MVAGTEPIGKSAALAGGGGRRRRARIVGAAALVVALGLAALWSIQRLREGAAARAAFPLADGRIEVDGISAPVEIFRDARGIPRIEAQTESDAFLALGFVHAQDRLAQMLWLRRSARGRSAEVVGEAGLAADRLARTLDIGGAADEQFSRVDHSTRQVLAAYARGVNARIERVRAGLVAPPLALRRLEAPLEDWRPADSLAVVKLYAWGLSGSLDVGLVLSDLIERLGGFEARRFFPDGAGREILPAPGQPPLTAGRGRAADPLVGDPLRRAARLDGRSIGSSAWVVGGVHSRSGSPILVADAHLEPTAPSLFHVAHIRGGDLDVAGATLPGVPAVWTGHNRRVAWASTHARIVTTDLYVETLHPSHFALYHDGRGWRELAKRIEVIRVRGAEDERLTVRSTHHGPLVQGLLEDKREPLALSWVGTRVGGTSAITSLLGVARADDADGLLSALADHHEPVLAVVYADLEGAAGMQVAGWVPRRALATGLVPLPGRARWYDWQGPIPFEGLPRLRLQEGRGWAIAADNRLVCPEDRGRIEWLWRTGERAKRIDELLRAAVSEGPLDLRRAAAPQLDVGADRARRLIAHVLELGDGGAPLGAEALEVVGLLREWDGVASAESVGAAAYHVFLECLTEALLSRHLGAELMRRYLTLPQADPGRVVFEIVRAAAAGGEPGGWTDGEAVTAAVRDSLREAWFRLSFRLGANRKKWRWGSLHPLRFHPFRARGWDGGEFAGLGPVSYGGSGITVNAAEYDPAEPFEVRVASTFRFAVDTGAIDRAFATLAPGQSEHPGHRNFSDGLERWLEGRPGPLGTARPLAEEPSGTRLVLEAAP